MTDAIFEPENGRFLPTARACSPWADNLLHGGPPAGLLARAIERLAGDSAMHLSRLTVDLFRLIPVAPLEVTARSVRQGRRIHAIEASLLVDGVEICRASGLLLRRSADPELAVNGTKENHPGPDGIEITSVSGRVSSTAPLREGFHTTVEARWVKQRPESGPAIVWLRIPVPFVAGEATSPLVRVAALSDFVNALSGGGHRGDMGFINADSTLYLHRAPIGEWICFQADRALSTGGLGVATAALYDIDGPIGRATQAVLANPVR
ncbi:MAG: thioesterase family protein [Dehalococcoidia bacterium]